MKSPAELDYFNPAAASKTQLEAMVLALLEQVKSKDAELQTKSAEIDAKEFKIQSLTHELAYLRRMRYGVKSEALTTLQRDLFIDHWNEDIAAIEAELEQLQDNQPVVTVIKPQRPRAGRQPLPDHLPRIEHHHEPEFCHCGHCGNALTKIRDDITEQLDVEPAKFFVHRHIRPQYACRRCETITAAPFLRR